MAADRRAPGQAIPDDIMLPFRTEGSGVLGRLLRLGSVADAILSRHQYPESIGRVLGEALVLGGLLGTALKSEGKFILQTKSDGPLRFLVVNFETPGGLRGYASFEPDRIAGARSPAALLGNGHLAMTIDRGGESKRYQGIVALEGEGLIAATHTYFRQSEQLPNYVRVAIARHYDGAAKSWAWRAGGLLVQHVPPLAVGPKSSEEDERLVGEKAEAWTRTKLLAATAEDHELTDPTLAPERLLYRLFHEDGVRVFPTIPLSFYCQCSRERVAALLESFGAAELVTMREPDGCIAVTCEYCAATYRFEPGEVA